ncbi:MAG: arginyl-tRNA synthetase [Methanohalophilus sp. T328-1]|uniref:arginine--tRNA ligase n=1 Tax=Methanohalophilus sp. DAL1 TaxID=1864608 RepID=UPI000794A56B|nr:arginine--tRNA ligase [Methanohalophilus sp. DAL1]KXS43088.1 MAG: arginyl-tRNA synthetase [Methanohalophilus sp. T328-1]OBZ34729.1 MAG: arginine--tRNA ligase [Methanohalophilus sp. DAL1]RSD34454.1 MAG: arginyl-tRNA synthetase [Methanohalophilus sp.]
MYLEFVNQVVSVLENAVQRAGFEPVEIAPEPSQHADLSSRVAFKLAAVVRKSPVEVANQIVENVQLRKNCLIESIGTTGPYINIKASRTYIDRTFETVRSKKEDFGGNFYSGKILLEHTSANPNGPLHVGHIRNSIIGDTLTRILRKTGYDVDAQYYVNDMGRQIAIVSWALEHFEMDPDLKSDHAIANVYIKANARLEDNPQLVEHIDNLMQLVESGDEEVIKRFDEAVDLAVKGIRSTLLRMNVHHDSFVNESGFVRSGEVSDIVDKIRKTGRTYVDDGALVVDLSDYGFEKTLVVQRSDGTSLYTTRDLAYHEWKARQADRIIDILGADHKLISGQLKATLNAVGLKEPEIVIFEFVSLPEGSMSTRRGQFITADELLDKVQARAFEEVEKRRPEMSPEFMEEVAGMVGIGAVRYDIIKVSPEKSTVFDWKAALDFEKQGGPFIQYSHARASSILKKAGEEGLWDPASKPNASVLTDESEVTLIKQIALFDKVLKQAADDLKPHIIAIYGRDLADAFNQFYRFSPVLGAETEELRNARLGLVDCARIVLANVLDTLGMGAPESM